MENNFREQVKTYIPRIKALADKEEEHLNMLVVKEADQHMIDSSKNRLLHFKQRYNEYNTYLKG